MPKKTVKRNRTARRTARTNRKKGVYTAFLNIKISPEELKALRRTARSAESTVSAMARFLATRKPSKREFAKYVARH